jgi:cell wall-associated NlpC family hydrolase
LRTDFKRFGLLVAILAVIASVAVMPALAAPDGISSYSVISEAYSWLGVPYKLGGESFSGVDCSGLVRQVYMRASGWQAYYYDRTAEGIRQASTPVWPPEPGDVVIFVDKTTGKATHVGIYIGPSSYGYWDAYFIHAGAYPGKVVEDRLYYSPYYGTGWWYNNYYIYFARYNPDYWIS